MDTKLFTPVDKRRETKPLQNMQNSSIIYCAANLFKLFPLTQWSWRHIFDCVSHSNHVVIIVMCSILTLMGGPANTGHTPVMVPVIVHHNLRLNTHYCVSAPANEVFVLLIGFCIYFLSRAHFVDFWVILSL